MKTETRLSDEEIQARIYSFVTQFGGEFVHNEKLLKDTVKTLEEVVNISDRLLPVKSYLGITQERQRKPLLDEFQQDLRVEQQVKRALGAQRQICTESIFIAACVILHLNISKSGTVYLMEGKSPRYKDTRGNRDPVILNSVEVLKKLDSDLTKPPQYTGKSKQDFITSGFNHLQQMLKLKSLIPAVKAFEEKKMVSGVKVYKNMIRREFNLTQTEFEKFCALADQLGVSIGSKRVRQSYKITQPTEKLVAALAARRGITMQKALNYALTQYFIYEGREALHAEAQRKVMKKAKEGHKNGKTKPQR